MKIGDKVRFLFETGGGIVKGFQGKDIALVEDAAEGNELFLQFFNVKRRKIACHRRGYTRRLAGDGTAGDNSHNVPHSVGDRGASARHNEIFDLF